MYYLPKAMFDILLTRELLKCEPVKRTLTISEEIDHSRSGKRTVRGIVYGAISLEVAITPVVTPRYIADHTEAYIIEYERLNAPLKQSTIDVELYSNGTLKGVNAAIEDRTKETIANAVKGITSIATMALAPGASLVFPKAREILIRQEETLTLCKQEIATALETARRLSNEIDDIEKEIGKAREAIVIKTEALAAAGGNAPPDLFSKLEGLKTDLKELEKRLRQRKEELAKTRKPLVHIQQYSVAPEFSPGGEPFTIDRLPPGDDLVLRWLEQATIEELAGKPHLPAPRHSEFQAEFPLAGRLDLRNKYPKALDAFANVVVGTWRSPKTYPVPRCVKDTDPGEGEIKCGGGIVYRQPVAGDLMICQERSCLSEKGKPEVIHDDRLFSKSLPIPQAGIRGSVPLDNGAFDKNTLSVEFNEAGTLVKLKYTTEAQAEKATASFADTAEALTKIRLQAIKAETERLEEETKRIEALKKKAEAEAALKKALKELQ